MKYSCGQCEYQTTSKCSIEKHRKSVHEAMKYPCEQCEYQPSIKLQKSEFLYLGLSVCQKILKVYMYMYINWQLLLQSTYVTEFKC